MADSIQVAAYEGGAIRLLLPEGSSGEAVLALPFSRLIAKVLRVPNENRDDIIGYATGVLKAMSPYPDEELSVGYEIVDENVRGITILAVALPESAADDIGEALDGAKLNVTRVDALALGQLRGLWSAIGGTGRRVVLFRSVDCITLFVLDGDSVSAIRAFSDAADLRREVMLSLLEAEDFGGALPVESVVTVGDVPTEPLAAFGPLKQVECGEDASLVGVAERTLDENSLNALPASWREVLDETRFKAKIVRYLTVAGIIWALAMGVLFGVPAGYDYMTSRQDALRKAHAKRYNEVKEMKDKTELVKKYSDHSHGALEIMKAVSDRLPDGITLTSWNYRRDEGLTISGEADDLKVFYGYKAAMSTLTDEPAKGEGEGEEEGEEAASEGEKVFPSVKTVGSVSDTKDGRKKFTLELSFIAEEEEE